jgi:hypothetical protein
MINIFLVFVMTEFGQRKEEYVEEVVYSGFVTSNALCFDIGVLIDPPGPEDLKGQTLLVNPDLSSRY